MIKIRPDVIKIKDPESGNYTSLLAIKGEKGDAYPVGAIFMSVDPTSPAELFGGIWERIYGRLLIAADDTHPAGESGGCIEVNSGLNGSNTLPYLSVYMWKRLPDEAVAKDVIET